MSTPLLLSAAEADARAGAFGAYLTRHEVRSGERVLFAAPGYEPAAARALICAVLGSLRAGVVPVVLDAATPARELAEIEADCSPALVVTDLQALPDGDRGGSGGSGHPDLPRSAADGSGGPLLGRPMHYTSGTTGRRKGVASGVLTPAQGEALWREEAQLWSMGPDDVHLVMSPLYHSAPLRFALATLISGGKVLCAGKFDVAGFRAAAVFGPTTAFSAPAQLARLREAGDPAAVEALERFRLLTHAGAPCPEPVKRWLLEVVGPDRVWEFYGSTEGQFTACSGAEWLERPGTVGRARPGRTLHVDDDGSIWCTVPEYARFTYWGDEEKTAAAWRDCADGWAFTVRDVGELDADGYLSLVGRRDDLIISGGVNVYPAEVERVLGDLPGVLEIVVFGVDDERWGQRVEAAFRGAAHPDDVLAAAARTLPPARRPRRAHRVETFPLTSTGKILRRALPELLG